MDFAESAPSRYHVCQFCTLSSVEVSARFSNTRDDKNVQVLNKYCNFQIYVLFLSNLLFEIYFLGN